MFLSTFRPIEKSCKKTLDLKSSYTATNIFTNELNCIENNLRIVLLIFKVPYVIQILSINTAITPTTPTTVMILLL